MERGELLAELRARVRQMEQAGRATQAVLPFGLVEIDEHLPGGGLALGALHELSGGGPDADHAAAATLFVAGILARLSGVVLWCLPRRDLFAPALAGAGLDPQRLIIAETGTEQAVAAVVEEGLRHGGLAAVVGEITRLPAAQARRLQLAAETSGVTGLLLRRWQKRAAAEPTAAMTRWRITPAPTSALPVPGVARARWHVALERCRGAPPAEWLVEACDEAGYLARPAELADRPAAADAARRLAAG